jgi:integrase
MPVAFPREVNMTKKKTKSTFKITSPSGIEFSIEDRGARGFYFNHTAPWGVRMRDLITRGTREEAIRLGIERIEQRYRAHARGPQVTLARVAAELMVFKEKSGRAKDYTRKIEEHLRLHILPALGAETPIGDITARELLALKHALGASDLDPKTCNYILTSLRQVFKHAEDPCGYIVAPALPRNFPVATWAAQETWQIRSPEQIAHLISVAPPEVRPVLGYLVNTGVRIGTALATETSWIDFTRMVVRYPASAMKGRHPHVVELNAAAESFLREALSVSPEKPFPFTYWFVLKRWMKLREELKEPTLRIHDLRHSFVSNQLAAGTPVHVVQQMAAHRSLAVTALYSHGTDEARRAAASRVQISIDTTGVVAALPPNLPPRVTKRAARRAETAQKEGGLRVPRDRIELPTRGFSSRTKPRPTTRLRLVNPRVKRSG